MSFTQENRSFGTGKGGKVKRAVVTGRDLGIGRERVCVFVWNDIRLLWGGGFFSFARISCSGRAWIDKGTWCGGKISNNNESLKLLYNTSPPPPSPSAASQKGRHRFVSDLQLRLLGSKYIHAYYYVCWLMLHTQTVKKNMLNRTRERNLLDKYLRSMRYEKKGDLCADAQYFAFFGVYDFWVVRHK